MINYPFVIISDIHCNDFSQFSYLRPDKVNSRLQEILDAIRDTVDVLISLGGSDIVITGDLFHTRGKIKPSVFNPVYDLFRHICNVLNVNVWLIPGNHDLEGKDSDTIGNATNAFSEITKFQVINDYQEVGNFVFIPWIEHKDEFVDTIGNIENPRDKVVFCHIGIDGVLDGVKGKVGTTIFERGFKYVFAGDYHNHKHLGNGVYSVGALCHHNFGDIGSVAGYLIVTEDEVKQVETSAPKFMDADWKNCKGNYVRLIGEMYDDDEANSSTKTHYEHGALYVQDLTTRPTIKDATHAALPVRVDLNIETALETYTKHKYGENYQAILDEALRIKNEHV